MYSCGAWLGLHPAFATCSMEAKSCGVEPENEASTWQPGNEASTWQPGNEASTWQRSFYNYRL